MDYREAIRRGGKPAIPEADKRAALGAWVDAALSIYASKGGMMGIFVCKSPPPGEPPALADDLQLHTEGAHDLRARIAE